MTPMHMMKKILIPFFAVWFVYFILNGIFDGAQYDLADPAVWASGFAAGVTEEVAFRGLAVTTLLRKFRSEKNIMISGILVGILFVARRNRSIHLSADRDHVCARNSGSRSSVEESRRSICALEPKVGNHCVIPAACCSGKTVTRTAGMSINHL